MHLILAHIGLFGSLPLPIIQALANRVEDVEIVNHYLLDHTIFLINFRVITFRYDQARNHGKKDLIEQLLLQYKFVLSFGYF